MKKGIFGKVIAIVIAMIVVVIGSVMVKIQCRSGLCNL